MLYGRLTVNPISAAWNTVARLAVIATGVGMGAAWGAAFGFGAHLASQGKRDFSSVRVLSAARYDLLARDGGAERARIVLSRAGLLPAETA